jgi:UDP-N-acetylglucosamine 2-epimerase
MYWTQTLMPIRFFMPSVVQERPNSAGRCSGMVNPYGEGRASETIVRVLTTVPLSQSLLMKRHSKL